MIMKPAARLSALIGTACLILAGVPAATASASAAASSPWRVFVRYPAAKGENVELDGLAALSGHDIWAAGSTLNLRTDRFAPFVVNWQGRSWRTIRLPAGPRSALGAQQASVTASSADNVWITSSQGWARWTGRRWQSGRLPVVGHGKEYEQSGQVLVFSPTDVWYLGTYSTVTTTASFAERYDGRGWQRMPAPGITNFQAGAASPSDICAVNGNVGEPDGTTTVLTCWNGRRWNGVALPASLDQASATVASILVHSPEDIWLGGGVPTSSGVDGLAGHWNGHAWQVTDLPAVQTLGVDVLSLLVPDGSGGLWARGVCECGGPAWRLWHLTGGKWTGPTIPVSGNPSFFFGMGLIPRTTTVLAAGVDGASAVIWINGRRP
jgi:hypothetical protein